MQFHLNHNPKKPDFEINHQHKIALIGSCFAENIGELMHENKFDMLLNPNGIIFNPKTILDVIQKSISNTNYNTSILLKHTNLFYSFLHHSSINEISETGLEKKINTINNTTCNYLKDAHFLILTFGSAFAYYCKQLNVYVANCHKQHSDLFEKRLLKLDELVKDYLQLIYQLQTINPKLKIIFTISPVKYLKDGVEENFISKSTLRLAINEIIHQTKNCFYFAAYELITDDLRDYRFYKEDLAHPNHLAIKYVWDKFSETVFSNETKKVNEKINEIIQATHHHAINENSNDHKEFKKTAFQKCLELEKQFPFLNFENEKLKFQ